MARPDVHMVIDVLNKQTRYSLFQTACTGTIIISECFYLRGVIPRPFVSHPKILPGVAVFIVASKGAAAFLFRCYLRRKLQNTHGGQNSGLVSRLMRFVRCSFGLAASVVVVLQQLYMKTQSNTLRDITDRLIKKGEASQSESGDISFMETRHNNSITEYSIDVTTIPKLIETLKNDASERQSMWVEMSKIQKRSFFEFLIKPFKEFGGYRTVCLLITPALLLGFDAYEYFRSSDKIQGLLSTLRSAPPSVSQSGSDSSSSLINQVPGRV